MQRKIQETFEQSHQTKLKLYRLVEKRQNLSAGHTTVYIFFSHDIPLQMWFHKFLAFTQFLMLMESDFEVFSEFRMKIRKIRTTCEIFSKLTITISLLLTLIIFHNLI